MTLNRRMMIAAAGLAASGGLPVAAQSKPPKIKSFSAAIEKAIQGGGVLVLPAGDVLTDTVTIDRGITITGVAGAGKTRILKAVVEALEHEGYKVLGGALSGAAKEELASKAEIRSETLAKYNHQLNKPTRQKVQEWVKHEAKMFVRALQGKGRWDREKLPTLGQKSVLILDESGMIDSRTLEPLVREAAKKGVTLLMVGDNEQLAPIGPGGPFLRITQDGATCHLSENFRQRNSPEDARAAAHVREGKIDKMLESYAERGRLTVARNRTNAANQLVSEWVKDGGVREPERAIILTQTRPEAKQINKLCQSARRLEAATNSKSAVIQNEIYHVGDRVMFHKKILKKGIENGYQGKITGIDLIKRTVTFKLDRKPTQQKRARGHTQSVSIAIKDLSEDHLTLGYAATTHKLQGQSIERAYCLLGGGMTNKGLTYVQLTRGEISTKLFIDRDHAGKKLADIADAMKQSGRKDLAHDQTDTNRLRLQIKPDTKES